VTRVKICGLTRRDDALRAVEAGADALGFVFALRSRRKADPAMVARIVAELPSTVTTVGVFQDQPLEVVRGTMLHCGLDVAQLHGAENAAYMEGLALPVLKAVGLLGPDDLRSLAGYRSLGVVLLDSAVVESAEDGRRRTVTGGTGTTFDWAWAASARRFARIVLSGGLRPENVAQAVRVARPWAVDVASGTESRPGRKDPDKLRSFIGQAKRAGAELEEPAAPPLGEAAATCPGGEPVHASEEWGRVFVADVAERAGGAFGRLEAALRARRAGGGKSVVPFFVGGYPDRETFGELLLETQRTGVEAIEVGLPSPDQVLDGPVIRRAVRETLARGTTPYDVLADIALARSRGLTVPVALMAYTDHFARAAGARLATEAAGSGVDGLLIVDPERPDANARPSHLRDCTLETVVLVGPTTSQRRYRTLLRGARGFVYCVSVEGGTGGDTASASTAEKIVERVRRHSDLPALVGFGVTGPDTARKVAAVADGVIVGTAVLERIDENRGASAVPAVGDFLREIRRATS